MDIEKVKYIIWNTARLIHDIYYFPKQWKLIDDIKNTQKCILVVGTSTYNNLGDHLINQKELDFIKDCFPERKVFEVPTQVFKRNSNKIASVLMPGDIVVITGGGWMGSLWPDDEYRMQKMIHVFSNYKIFIFPQTIYYENSEASNKILIDANNCYRSCSNITIMLRDMESYVFAKANFSIDKTKIILAPDIALYGLHEKQCSYNKLIGVCLRNDRENISKKDFSVWIQSWAQKNKWEIFEFSTVLKRSVPVWKRNHELKKIMKKISSAQIVITNRLHGMIFSLICGCKCIALDNKTHKVSGVYNLWLKDNPKIVMIPDTEEQILFNILNQFSQMCDNKNENYTKLEKEFNRIKDILRLQAF